MGGGVLGGRRQADKTVLVQAMGRANQTKWQFERINPCKAHAETLSSAAGADLLA